MNIIFVCHGSICRSPAAEMIFKNLSNDHSVISRAVSNEEIGNDIYPPMKRELLSHRYNLEPHSAKRITYEDYLWADYIFYMDNSNLYYLNRMFPNDTKKIKPINIYCHDIEEIEDPWYTGNYQKVVNQIRKCIDAIIKNII